MLGILLHAPRGPFYSPKAARSRWEQARKEILAFCRLVHRTVRCTTRHCPVHHRTLSGAPPNTVRCRFLSYSGAADRWRFGAVGAPDTVWCTPDSPVPPSDRWLGHASRADCAADRWLGRPLAHRTVRWFLVVCRRRIPESSLFTRASLAHRTLSDAPPDSPVHHRTVRCTQTEQSLDCTAKTISFCLLSDSST
jgi:hypothetical protein